MADEPALNDDFVDLLRAFVDADVDFVVVDAHALVPRRIDVLTEISGVSFEEAVREATRVEARGIAFRVIGRSALLANKRASARPKDLEDVRLLEAAANPVDE